MELFKENWEAIRARKCEGFWPQDKGTYHTMKELEEFRAEHPFAWSEKIAECKRRWGMMKGE